MGLEATLNRKRTVEKAAAAEAKVVECIDAVNRQAAQLARLQARTLALEQARTKTDTSLDAQGRMILDVEQKSAEARAELLREMTEYIDRQVVEVQGHLIEVLQRRVERFETLGFWARLRWLLIGPAPSAAAQAARQVRLSRIYL